jgi:hypothetical protein
LRTQGTTAERVLIDAAARSRTISQEVLRRVQQAPLEARIYTDDLAVDLQRGWVRMRRERL